MKVLVIEDDPVNVESAKRSLTNHELTIATSIQQAFDILAEWRQEWLENRERRFDVVLTDVYMPRGDFKGWGRRVIHYSDYENPDTLPAGLAFAIAAATMGAKVGICSDRNHHKDWITALLDLAAAGSRIGDQMIQVFFAPVPKNWGRALFMLSGERLDSNEDYVEPLKTATEA